MRDSLILDNNLEARYVTRCSPVGSVGVNIGAKLPPEAHDPVL